jgi:hypothetical protein
MVVYANIPKSETTRNLSETFLMLNILDKEYSTCIAKELYKSQNVFDNNICRGDVVALLFVE